MNTLGFARRYVPLVLDGTKTATIRRTNSRLPHGGDRIVMRCGGKPFAYATVVDVVPFARLESAQWAHRTGHASTAAMLRALRELYGTTRHLVVITFEDVVPFG